MAFSNTFILLSGFSIICVAVALPSNYAGENEFNQEYCVKRSPENDEIVNNIVLKLSEYLNNLTMDYEQFDIRLVKVVVEGHSDDEVEEKETQIELVVNDCPEEKIIVENRRLEENKSNEIIKSNEVRSSESKEVDASEENECDESQSEEENDSGEQSDVSQNDVNVTDANSISKNALEIREDKVSGKKPEVIILDLDENGNKLLQLYEKQHGSSPYLMYIQKMLNNTLSYLFVN